VPGRGARRETLRGTRGTRPPKGRPLPGLNRTRTGEGPVPRQQSADRVPQSSQQVCPTEAEDPLNVAGPTEPWRSCGGVPRFRCSPSGPSGAVTAHVQHGQRHQDEDCQNRQGREAAEGQERTGGKGGRGTAQVRQRVDTSLGGSTRLVGDDGTE